MWQRLLGTSLFRYAFERIIIYATAFYYVFHALNFAVSHPDPLITTIIRKHILWSLLYTVQVIVSDARPLNDGKKALFLLSKVKNISCLYIPLSSVARLMNSVTRVLLGTSAVLSNGSLLAPAGTGTNQKSLLTLLKAIFLPF